MVNSDNGKIMHELMLSIVDEYDLPGIEPNIKKIFEMPDEELMRYEGVYEIDEYGQLEIVIEDDHLKATAAFLDESIQLYAENDTLFFDRSDGTPINFDVEDGVVSGFNVQGLQAVKVK